MKLMSDGGVSSVAVVDDETGQLLSAVSATDIGKVGHQHPRHLSPTEHDPQIVVPSQSNQILSTPLHQFISQIKVLSPAHLLFPPVLTAFQGPHGSTDGADRYPGMSLLSGSPCLCLTLENSLLRIPGEYIVIYHSKAPCK